MRDGSGELSGLGQTRTQETGDLLDQGVGSHESIVLASELLDELLVLVELLQVLRVCQLCSRALAVSRVLTSVDMASTPWCLARSISCWSPRTQMDMPGNCQPLLLQRSMRAQLTGTGNSGELDSSRETLVTLGVVVLEADLELDGLEEVPLLGLVGVLKELLDVRTNAGDRDFRHVGWLSPKGSFLWWLWRWWLKKKRRRGGAAKCKVQRNFA